MAVLEKIQTLEKYMPADVATTVIERTLDKLISRSRQKEERDLAEVRGKLEDFEKRYDMSSATFYERFHSGELGDDEDWFVWDALFEMSKRIKERINLLRENENGDG